MRALVVFSLLCSWLPAQSPQVQAALAAGSYFPLEIGNRWVYRIDSRFASAGYQTWRVDRTEDRDGRTYIVMSIGGPGTYAGESYFRVDERGRIYVLTDSGEQLFLDIDSADPAQLQVQQRGVPFRGGIGVFSDTLTYRNPLNSLIIETGALGRGIGLLASTRSMLSGSSGGFVEGRTLVEAAIGGKLRFALPAAGLHLGVEDPAPDLTGKQAENCAVPCYFVACYLAPGADPPGTYKPCTRARVALSDWPADASHAVRVRLTAPDGTLLSEQVLALDSAPGESAGYSQIRLYSEANQPYAPGAYQLSAATEDGAAQSTITLQIK